MKKLIILSLSTILSLSMVTSAFAEAGGTGLTKILRPTPIEGSEDAISEVANTSPVEIPVPTLISYNPSITDITVKLDDKTLTFTKKLINVEGNIYFPMRELLNNLGVTNEEIFWNSNDKSVTITTQDHTIMFTIGSNVSVVDGIDTTMEATPFISEGSTYLPVETVAEILDLNAVFNLENKTISLISSKNTVDDVEIPTEEVAVEEDAIEENSIEENTVEEDATTPAISVITDAKVLLNGVEVEISEPIIEENGTVYFSVTDLASELGSVEDATIDENGNINLINNVNGDIIVFNKLSKDYTVNDEIFTADTETIEYNNTIYAPIFEIANAFGFKVATDDRYPNTFALSKTGVIKPTDK